MRLTCETCGNFCKDANRAGEHACTFWCFTIFDEDDEYKKPSSYFCAHHTSGPGVMMKVDFEDKNQVTFS